MVNGHLAIWPWKKHLAVKTWFGRENGICPWKQDLCREKVCVWPWKTDEWPWKSWKQHWKNVTKHLAVKIGFGRENKIWPWKIKIMVVQALAAIFRDKWFTRNSPGKLLFFTFWTSARLFSLGKSFKSIKIAFARARSRARAQKPFFTFWASGSSQIALESSFSLYFELLGAPK